MLKNQSKKIAFNQDAKKEYYVSRTKKRISKLVERARKNGDEKIMIVIENNGEPKGILEINIYANGEWKWTKKTKMILS